MTFREFLEIKTAQAIVEHIETLSDDQACEFVDQLDESTVQLIEALLNEISLSKLGRIETSLSKKLKKITSTPARTDEDDLARRKAREELQAARRRSDLKLKTGVERLIGTTKSTGHVPYWNPDSTKPQVAPTDVNWVKKPTSNVQINQSGFVTNPEVGDVHPHEAMYGLEGESPATMSAIRHAWKPSGLDDRESANIPTHAVMSSRDNPLMQRRAEMIRTALTRRGGEATLANRARREKLGILDDAPRKRFNEPPTEPQSTSNLPASDPRRRAELQAKFGHLLKK